MSNESSSDSAASTSDTFNVNNQVTSSTSSPSSSNDPLLQSIKKIVTHTNSVLATFQKTTDDASSALISRLHGLATQARLLTARAISTYESRGYYGPQIIGGTAILVGGAVALRRGKISGAAAGVISGAAAYGNIYGYEDYSATSWRNSVPKKET